MLPDFLFLFSFPYSADHKRDWPPCKVVFSGWQPIVSQKTYRKAYNDANAWRRVIYLSRGYCTSRRTGKVAIAHGSVNFCEATLIGLVDESKESCTGARRTGICVAPRHVDASRDFTDFILFYPHEQRGGGGGGYAARLSLFVLFSLFSRPQAGSATV